MNEVSVTAEKQRKVVEAEKTIFNVAQTSLSKGGNAQDVLKTLPSVSVDMEGTVRYRGSEDVQVLVNGRMSMLSLDQIPAETIDRIELVSNPSARFDAEGAGGIINVILKKEREQGFNATAQATAATGDKYNASLEMGFQQTGMAAYLAGGYDAENFWTAGRNVLETRNASSQQRSSVLSQQDSGLDRSRNLWLYGGVILNPDEKTTIEPWIGVVRNHNTNTSTMQYTFRDIAQGTSSLQERTNTRIQATNTVEGGLWTERTFSSQKHKLTLDAYFTRNEALATLAAEQRDVDTVRGSTMQPALLPSDFQRTRLPTLQTSFVGQLDYAQPITGIGGGMLLETGVKITTRRLDNNFTSESATGQAFTTPTEDSRWQIDRDVSNHFVFDERVLAGYATAAGKLGAKNEWTYSAGVRAEITAFASDQRTSGERMARTYWNLFPSASVKYAVSEQESLALGFSRRISRPSAEQLNPFPQFLDPFNLRAGNPFLQPEFTNSLEASYNMVLENGSVQLNLDLVHLGGMIDRAVQAASQTRPERRFELIRDPVAEEIHLLTDPDRLVQVFINLISNARKYCDADPGVLRIVVRQKGGRITVDFIDNGKGIPKESQRIIFEKFARLTDQMRAGGAGLGLAIVREIMTNLGGSITYLPGQRGAAFRVMLPLRLEKPAPGAVSGEGKGA
jgi:hypothetical protein